MKTNKVTGLIYISGGKINVDSLRDDEKEITDNIQQLLILKNVIDQNLVEFEREYQKKFVGLPKIPNQYDLEDSIREIESEQKGDHQIES